MGKDGLDGLVFFDNETWKAREHQGVSGILAEKQSDITKNEGKGH
jgi:hypothetical protein